MFMGCKSNEESLKNISSTINNIKMMANVMKYVLEITVQKK